jgi:AsmA-like protein
VVNFCWFLFKWGLLVGLATVIAVVPYVYQRLDAEVCRRVEDLLAQQYPDLEVTVRSAQFVEGEGIEVRGLSIVEPGADGPHAELLHLEELFLSCRADLEELISGRPVITRVFCRHPTLRITRRPDGSYSCSKLLPLPRSSDSQAKVVIENGTVEVFDPTRNPSGTLVFRNVNFTLGKPSSEAATDPRLPLRSVEGTFDADYVRRVVVNGQVSADGSRWSMSGTAEGLEISPSLFQSLPTEMAQRLAALQGVRGQADFDFQVSHASDRQVPHKFDLKGRFSQGRVDDSRLPSPLTDVEAEFHIDNRGVAINNLTAHGGQAELEIREFLLAGFDLGSQMWLTARVTDLELNRRMMDMLPDALREKWWRFMPTGRINMEAVLDYDGRQWTPASLTVDCLDVAFSYDKFPYRMEQCTGCISLADDVLSVNLVAYGGSRPIEITGWLRQPLTAPYGRFDVIGKELELDEKLFSAMKEKPQLVIRSLDPRGTIDVEFSISTEGPGRPPVKNLRVDLNRCRIEYDKFPYPLGNIQGTLIMQSDRPKEDRWTFHDLEGTNDTARVVCSKGSLTSIHGQSVLDLRFTAENVPLEEELRDAMSPNMYRLWNDLKLQGKVKVSDLVVHYESGWQRPSVSFRATPQGDSTSIEPACFPYRLDNLQGTLVYDNGHVTIDRFHGRHGEAEVTSKVDCGFLADGGWRLNLDRLAVDRLRLDRELTQKLPGRLQRMVAELKPDGAINVLGKVGIARDPDVRAEWDLNLVFHQGSFDFGVKLDNVNGKLQLKGDVVGEEFRSLGNLEIDSLECKGIQFTQVTGPISIDNRRVLLGKSVDGASSGATGSERVPRPLLAQMFGGSVRANGSVRLDEPASYQLTASIREAGLPDFAQELMVGRQSLRGKIDADVHIWGSGRSLNALGGRGGVRLREADVNELPVMVSLLDFLGIREPDPSKFSDSDIEFVIEGNHIYLNHINFKGDSMSLVGEGEMDFDRNVNLVLGARLGRGTLNLPVLREILGGAGDQLVLIHVEGPLENPRTWKETLPGVTKALQQLQAELGGQPVEPMRFPGPGQGLLPQAGQVLFGNGQPPWRR